MNLPMPTQREVILAEPRGFCAGVDRAIEIVERALAKYGRPIYVRHEIVHNTHVVNDLRPRERSLSRTSMMFHPARRWCSLPMG